MSKNTDKPPGATPRPSSADYPVDPAERVNQEARLRKAAAAGASSLKSPIPSLRSQLPSPLVAAPVAAEPQAVLPNPAPLPVKAPNDGPAMIPEIPGDRTMPRMNENEEILIELRRISAWADRQRKLTKWSLIFLVIFISVATWIGLRMEPGLKTNLESNVSPRQPDWYDVDRHVRLGEFEKAISIGEELLLKTPEYPEAHKRLAGAYLASGNVEKARDHYAEAFRLFPSEENEKLLNAMEKRVKPDGP